jgi:hypothetical protein
MISCIYKDNSVEEKGRIKQRKNQLPFYLLNNKYKLFSGLYFYIPHLSHSIYKKKNNIDYNPILIST